MTTGTVVTRTCEGCGTKFQLTVKRSRPQKFCTENCRKRHHERETRAACPQCSEPMGAGSGYGSHTPDLCRTCHYAAERERVAARAHFIEDLWGAGLPMPEIAARLGWSMNHLRREMDRLRGFGFHLPYRYHTGKRHGTKFPHLQKAA